MERFTQPGFDPCANCGERSHCEHITNPDFTILCGQAEMYKRLSAYEDIGLEPQEIKDILELFHSYRHICGEMPPDRLRELVEADRDGRCYITTVKSGESVFLPNEKGKIIGARVQGISLPAHGKNLIIHLGGYPAEYLWSDREGKDWWRTYEAAEAALKGERDEQVP